MATPARTDAAPVSDPDFLFARNYNVRNFMFAPARSPKRDRIKLKLATVLAAVRSVARRRDHPRPYAVWTPRVD